jgi:hypothetical protein
MNRYLRGLPLIILALLFALPSLAFASGPGGGKLVLGGTYTLARAETLNGDLVVIGGAATLEPDSLVTGNVLLIGGTLGCDGQIVGDLVEIGGLTNLGASSVVRGDVTTLGGILNQAPGAHIYGQILGGATAQGPFQIPLPSFQLRPFAFPGLWQLGLAPVFQALSIGLRTLALAALAVLVVLFWAEPTRRVARAATDQALVAGGVGLLTIVVAPALLVLLGITLCLIPFSVIGALALAGALVYGWLAVGQEVGRRLAGAFHWVLHPAAEAGIGTLILTLVAGLVGLVPCVGWVVPAVIGLVGLGGVVMTRFGARPYPPVQPAASPPATPASA